MQDFFRTYRPRVFRRAMARGLGGCSLTVTFAVTLAAVTLAACAASPKPVAEPAAAAAPVAADGPLDSNCQSFGAQLCERLGAESAACAALGQAVQLMPPSACREAVAAIDFSYARIEVLRRDCMTVAERLCAQVGDDTEVCDKIRTDMRESVPPGHCARLLSEYPALEERLLAQLERERPLAVELQQAIVAGQPPAFGPEAAKVTLVEFSDFQCPYCAMAAETLQQVKANYGDRVRVVFRQFPLSFHEHAHAAAEASLAAHAQGKFWAFHDLIFENQSALSPNALRGYAEKAGLDLAAYDDAMGAKTYADAVRSDLTLGEQVHVSGTPTMFLNGARVSNPTDYAEVAPLIEAALAATATAPVADVPAQAPAQAPAAAPQ